MQIYLGLIFISELKINKIDNDVFVKRFYNTYQLSEYDINEFRLLLRKGVYPYEYWTVGIDLMKQSYRQKISFIVH